MSRMESLLSKFNLENRLVSNIEKLNVLINQNFSINYDACETTINENIEFSREWLINHIN